MADIVQVTGFILSTGKLRALKTEGQTAIVTAEEFQKETKQ